MKKLYAILLTTLPFIASAQTIYQTDLPTAGTAFTTGNDSNYVAAIPAGGTGQTWNYSGLMNYRTDTIAFISSVGTPYASTFPGSNLATYDQGSMSYSYLTSNSSGLYTDGVASPSFSLVYNPQDLFIPVPISYGSTRNNVSRIQIDTSITDSSGTTHMRIVLRNESSFLVDGSGSLTTPTATYPAALRLKITNLMYDSLYIDLTGFGLYLPVSGSVSQSTSYRFLTSGLQVNYIMELEADSLGTTSSSSSFLVDATVSVPKISNRNQLVAYPNPAFSNINFKDLNDDSELVIVDVNGSEVIRKNGITSQSVNIEALPNGTYFYEVKQKESLYKGRFVVQH
jgi:hypothetical protein